MTSKEALKRLWQETAPATYMKDFDKKECCDAIERDLEVLQQIKVKIDEEIKKQEKVIIEYDNYAWKTQQLNTDFLIAVRIKNTLEKIKECLEEK